MMDRAIKTLMQIKATKQMLRSLNLDQAEKILIDQDPTSGARKEKKAIT
jgi:hypothetical protein